MKCHPSIFFERSTSFILRLNVHISQPLYSIIKSNSCYKMCAWSKTKQDGKDVFDKGWGLFEKLGGPVNRLSNKMGCEAFFPMTLDHECDKSARILKSFCG